MSPPPDIPELRTARLLLRGFTRPDMDVWNERLFGDLDVIRFLPIDGEADIFGLHCARYGIERPPDGD